MTAHHQTSSVSSDSAIVATPTTPPPASNVEVFRVGSVIECLTIHGDKISGEVMAFDNGARVIVLKSPVEGGKTQYNLVNLALVQNNVKTLREAPSVSSVIPQVDLEKVNLRIKSEMRKKMSLLSDIPVTKEGQRVFAGIRKTIEDVKWDRDRIVLFGEVIVKPPYSVSDVARCQLKNLPGDTKFNTRLNRQDQILAHVKKIIEKLGPSDHSSGNEVVEKDENCEMEESRDGVPCLLAEESSANQQPSSASLGVSSGDNSYSSASSAAAEKTSNSSNGPSPPPPSHRDLCTDTQATE